MTRLEDRQTLVAEIAAACAAGARLAPACALVGIDLRTFQRWRGGDGQVQFPRQLARSLLAQRAQGKAQKFELFAGRGAIDQPR